MSRQEATNMSETTAAGVEMLNAFASNGSMNAEEEELLLQQRILQSKAMDDRRARQKAEEDLKFARHKLADRDKKLEDMRNQLAEKSRQVGYLQKKVDAHDSVVAAYKTQIGDLGSKLLQANKEMEQLRESLSLSNQLRQSTSSVVFSPDGSTSQGSGGDGGRLTRQKSLTSYIQEKAKNMGMKRRYKSMKRYHEEASQAMERCLMEEADMHSMVTERCLSRGIQPINDLLKAEAGIVLDESTSSSTSTTSRGSSSKKPSCLVSYDGIKRYGRGTGIGHNTLTFNEPLDLKMPEDIYIDAKVAASGFSAEYQEFKKNIHAFAQNLKKESDSALNGLWFIFTEKDKGARGGCVLANPKEDFQKEVRSALTKTRTNITDLIRMFNSNIKSILSNERRVKQEWLKEQRPSRSIEVQVDIPPPEDPRIAEMVDQIDFLKKRQQEIHAEHTAKSSDLEMQREKAEVNMQFLQQKVFALHSAVHTALHSVYKHRYHWGPRCPNHFAPLEKSATKKRQLEVGYNVLLGEAIDLEIKSLGQFADYFVSDQLFGVDLAAAFNQETAKTGSALSNSTSQALNDGTGAPLVLKKKEAIPMKKAKVDQARKLSNQLDTMLKSELAASGNEKKNPVEVKKESENAAPVQSKTIVRKSNSAVAFGTQAPSASNAQPTSGRRHSTNSSFVPACATKSTVCSSAVSSSTAAAPNRRAPLSTSPPNAHVDAAAAVVPPSHPRSYQQGAAAPSSHSSRNASAHPSPVQVALVPTSTINLELGIDMAAPPKPPQSTTGGAIPRGRRTSTVGGFVAFAQ